MTKFLLIIMPLLILSCKNVPRESGRDVGNSGVDQKQLLLEWNRTMVDRQQRSLLAYQDSLHQTLVKSNKGFYYKVIHKKPGEPITTGDVVTVKYVVKALNNEVLLSAVEPIVVGKSQDIPTGLHNGLLLMESGDSAMLLLPYNLAYGVKGVAGKVLPYQPVRIDITIEAVEKR